MIDNTIYIKHMAIVGWDSLLVIVEKNNIGFVAIINVKGMMFPIKTPKDVKKFIKDWADIRIEEIVRNFRMDKAMETEIPMSSEQLYNIII